MRRTLALACLCAFVSAQERAFVETETERDSYFVHEPIRLTLRIGFDASYFETNVVQLFHKDLDVPVQVRAPWLNGLSGTVLRRSPAHDTGLSFALNGAQAEAPPAGDRGRHTLLEITRTYLPTRPGELVIAAPRLRYVYGTKFVEDFVNGRRAVDERDAFAKGKPLTLKVRTLPEEGRPPGFTGAVGRGLVVRAEAAPKDIEAGTVFQLTLRIEGQGNLELFDAPRLDGIEGFHVYGMIDDKDPARRTVTYDLAALSAKVTELPAIPFVYFDTLAPAGYRTLRTRPIPLTVRPIPGETDAVYPPSAKATQNDFPLLLVAVLMALFALGFLLWMRARRRGLHARDHTREAAAAFKAQAGEPGTDLATALTEFLAAHLRCPAASMITPDLKVRLTAAGVPTDLAARTAKLLESLVAERYGGARAGEQELAGARELVDALEAVFGGSQASTSRG